MLEYNHYQVSCYWRLILNPVAKKVYRKPFSSGVLGASFNFFHTNKWGPCMVACNSKSHLIRPVLKQNNFSAYSYILGWFLPSVNSVNDQQKVTKSFQDRVENFNEKKWPFFSGLFRVCNSCSVWGFSYFVCKKFLSTEKLILNTKIAVADDSDWSELKHFFSCILFAWCVYKQAVLFVYDLGCISEI